MGTFIPALLKIELYIIFITNLLCGLAQPWFYRVDPLSLAGDGTSGEYLGSWKQLPRQKT